MYVRCFQLLLLYTHGLPPKSIIYFKLKLERCRFKIYKKKHPLVCVLSYTAAYAGTCTLQMIMLCQSLTGFCSREYKCQSRHVNMSHNCYQTTTVWCLHWTQQPRFLVLVCIGNNVYVWAAPCTSKNYILKHCYKHSVRRYIIAVG